MGRNEFNSERYPADERSSVREALVFSALLRQDASIPDREKLAYVDHVLDLLDLSHLQDAIIGTPAAGLNAEQRKRVTIAVEVVSKPEILFCDEPTTGLDTKSALRVVNLLRRLARTGLAVICTIHQPVRLLPFVHCSRCTADDFPRAVRRDFQRFRRRPAASARW